MLVEESPAPNYIMVEDGPAPQYVCCRGITGAYEGRQKPPMSCRGVSAVTYRGRSPCYISSAYE